MLFILTDYRPAYCIPKISNSEKVAARSMFAVHSELPPGQLITLKPFKPFVCIHEPVQQSWIWIACAVIFMHLCCTSVLNS